MPLVRLYKRMPPLTRLVVQLAAVVCICLVVISGLVVAIGAKGSADRVVASCRFYHDLAVAQLSPQTTSFGVSIVADARLAFQELRCSGTLPAPDPRVAAVLATRPH